MDFTTDFSGGGTAGVSGGAGSFDASGQPVPMGSPAATDFSGGTAWGGGLSNIFSQLGKNPGMLLSAAPLAIDMLKGTSLPSAGTALQSQGADAASQGRTLTAFRQSGTLPAGLQSVVDANTNAAVAKIRSSYANLGLSGSTMESQAIEQAKQGASGQVAEIANQLAQQGMQWSGLASEDSARVLSAQMQQDQQFQNSLALFARGLAGGMNPGTGNS